MEAYTLAVEQKMKRFFDWLSEKDRRRYAAVEAAKLGHGGVEYVSRVLRCDPKTIWQGMKDLEGPQDAAAGRLRKKGGGRKPASTARPQLEENLRRLLSESLAGEQNPFVAFAGPRSRTLYQHPATAQLLAKQVEL